MEQQLQLKCISYKNAKSLNRDFIYLQMAQIWSQNSMATRAKVGSLVVKDSLIIADGYNGMPSGFKNSCEHEANGDCQTNKEVLHAESNALMKLVKFGGTGTDGSIMYCTYSPCIECAKLIVQAGIKQCHFLYFYHNLSGLKLLFDAGIECYHHFALQHNQDDMQSIQDEEVCSHVNFVQHISYQYLTAKGMTQLFATVGLQHKHLIVDMSNFIDKLTDAMSEKVTDNLLEELERFAGVFNVGFIDMNAHVFDNEDTYHSFMIKVMPVNTIF